jgi:hypothetical protein
MISDTHDAYLTASCVALSKLGQTHILDQRPAAFYGRRSALPLY